MKKLLLSTVAISGLALAAAPAQAEGVKLDISGYFKGYAAYTDQDEATNTETRSVDFFRDTELHFTGETTLDNGLTVGVAVELDVDGADNNAAIDESYAYLSSNWGRVNMGEEDGAGYLLQVAAPSADSNVDGVRTYIQNVNFTAMPNATIASGTRVSYDMTQSAKDTKVTYLTPVINGFQGGVSYSPDDGQQNGLVGTRTDDVEDALGATWEVAARYEGMVNNIGFAIGAGYAQQELERDLVVTANEATDDVTEWNVGLDMDMGAFGLGVAYYENDSGEKDVDGVAGGATIDTEETLVVGVDYTTGPFKLGASYFNSDNYNGTQDEEVTRYTAGVVYSYGPGMTLRGSLSQIEVDEATTSADDATSLLIGTQIKF